MEYNQERLTVEELASNNDILWTICGALKEEGKLNYEV